VVLDIELTDDLGGPQLFPEHEARLCMESDRLRRELEQAGLFHVLDNAPAQALITRISRSSSTGTSATDAISMPVASWVRIRFS
jgi:hypothetical protein